MQPFGGGAVDGRASVRINRTTDTKENDITMGLIATKAAVYALLKHVHAHAVFCRVSRANDFFSA